MRISVKLNGEAQAIIEYDKKYIEDNFKITTTYGSIVNRIVLTLNSDFGKIDWNNIKNAKIDIKLENNKANYDYNTTLNVDDEVNKHIEKLQNKMRKIFGVSRVHKAFAIKMILRAYYLQNKQKVNIYKE